MIAVRNACLSAGPQCKYRALSASELCKSEGHTTVLLDAVKRFFSCNNCKSRTISLDKLPRLPCQNCGGESWQKAPMGKVRNGDFIPWLVKV